MGRQRSHRQHARTTLWLLSIASLPSVNCFLSSSIPFCASHAAKWQKPSLLLHVAAEEKWEAGDFYKDIERLESAIQLANADREWGLQDLRNQMDYLARQRRALLPDVRRYLVIPLFAAWTMVEMSNKSRLLGRMSKAIASVVNANFWLLHIIFPIIVLRLRRWTKTPPEVMPDELRALGESGASDEYLAQYWTDPKLSCDDYILCLLEQWSSVANGMLLVGILNIMTRMTRYPTIHLWMSIAQLATRCGAVSSLHMFPQFLYKLEQSNYIKPVGLFPFVLLRAVLVVFAVFPVASAFDWMQILSQLGWYSRLAVVGLIMTYLSLVLSRLKPRKGSQLDREPAEKTSRRLRTAAVALWTALWYRPIASWLRSSPFQPLLRSIAHAPILSFIAVSLSAFVAIIPLRRPWLQLGHMQKIFKVSYVHDLSLTVPKEEFLEVHEEQIQKRTKWRYQLEWIEPERMSQVFRKAHEEFLFKLFIEGSDLEKLDRLENQLIADENVEIKVKCLDRIAEASANRSGWKKQAMESMARKHQEDFEKGTYDDPLGVAVQQTLGIGLGFDSRHMRKLEPGEKPTMRRLQARAAKSAVKYVQELTKPERLKQAISGVENKTQAEEIIQRVRNETREEMNSIAQRLSNAIPPFEDKADSEFDETFEVYQAPKYRSTGSHEMEAIDSPTVRSMTNSSRTDGRPNFLDAYEAYINKKMKSQKDGDNETSYVIT